MNTDKSASTPISRRSALGAIASGLAAPFVFRHTAGAAPSETVLHASFGASGMAFGDIGSLTASKNLKLVAVAEVDLARVAEVKKRFPDVHVYQDWRELLDKEKSLDSCNISTPDHMHAPITMRAIQRGLHVYTQKPLTQTIYEARQLAKAAADKKIVSQMGIQIHSAAEHRTIVAIIQSFALGKVLEVHSWSGKQWGDRNQRPHRVDEVPKDMDWDKWLGVAPERAFIKGYYHPAEWRKRLDFGTGTFGDMGCHILDPVFASVAINKPLSVISEGDEPNQDSWGLNNLVKFEFRGTKYTLEPFKLTWYNGDLRPPKEILDKAGVEKVAGQGSIYIGTEGVMYSPYVAFPTLLPAEKFKDMKLPRLGGQDHYLQFVEAVRGNDKTSAPFSYSGPLTEAVLLGCLSTRFANTKLTWDSNKLKFADNEKASAFVRKTYRKGWEVEGL